MMQSPSGVFLLLISLSGLAHIAVCQFQYGSSETASGMGSSGLHSTSAGTSPVAQQPNLQTGQSQPQGMGGVGTMGTMGGMNPMGGMGTMPMGGMGTMPMGGMGTMPMGGGGGNNVPNNGQPSNGPPKAAAQQSDNCQYYRSLLWTVLINLHAGGTDAKSNSGLIYPIMQALTTGGGGYVPPYVAAPNMMGGAPGGVIGMQSMVPGGLGGGMVVPYSTPMQSITSGAAGVLMPNPMMNMNRVIVPYYPSPYGYPMMGQGAVIEK